MKNYLLVFLAVFATIWLIATAEALPDAQSLSITNTHLFNWQIAGNYNFTTLLVINVFCLPIFIFFLKFLLEKKIKNIDFDLIFITGLAGITSALPNAGLILLLALFLFFILMVTFNSGFEDMLTTIKLTLFFYFSTLTFFALSGLGIILTLTISLVIGSLVATIFKIFKNSIIIAILFFLVLLMIIVDRPSYHN